LNTDASDGNDDKIARKMGWEAAKCVYSPEEIEGMRLLGENNKLGSEVSDTGFLKWQYLENPAGSAVIWLAKAHSEIIGQVAFIPVRARLQGKEVPGAFAVNVITDSRYRNKGVFAILARKAVKDLTASGTKLMYGLPNQAAYPTWIKRTGLRDVGALQDFIKVISWDAILSKKAGNPILRKVLSLLLRPLFFSLRQKPDRNWTVEEIKMFGAEFDTFWEKNSQDYGNCVIRSSQHLNWRFTDCPVRDYSVLAARMKGELKGFVVLRTMTMTGLKTGWIADIFAARSKEGSKALRLLAKEAEDHFGRQKVEVIRCRTTRISAAYTALPLSGFRKVPFFLMNWPTRMILLCFPGDNRQVPAADGIYLTMGDNDYI